MEERLVLISKTLFLVVLSKVGLGPSGGVAFISGLSIATLGGNAGVTVESQGVLFGLGGNGGPAGYWFIFAYN